MRLIRHLLVAVVAAGCSIRVAPPPLAIPIAQHESEGHAAEEHHSGSKTLNLFVGGSGEAGDLDGITIGLDYEYRLTTHWGIGGFPEAVGGLDRSFAGGLQGYWHAHADLVLVVGAAAERHHDE